MAGVLKRKFDQLEDDFFSSSSSSSSGSFSFSSSPSSSVFPAWNSDEEGPCGQALQPDQDSSGLQSFTRESWEPLPTHMPFPSPKVKLPFAALGCLSYFLLARDTWACLDFPLTLGVLGL